MEDAALTAVSRNLHRTSAMVTPDSIRQSIADGLPCDRVEVRGDGQHFEALVVSAAFDGLSKVRQHQLVYAAMGDRMREEVHALSMITLTPAQWAARSGG
jgi:acid stress-induced BolA-like protein IbaG/YrbA